MIVLKALNKELIDEVLGLSKEFNGIYHITTLMCPPANVPSARMTAAYAIEAPAPEREVVERREIVIPEPGEVPRSVRDWDVMSGSLGGGKSEHGGAHSVAASHKSHKSHKSKHSTHRSRSVHRSEHRSSHRSSSSGSTVKRGHSRSPSPVLVVRSKSRHRSRSSAGHVKEKEIDGVEENEIGDSNAMHVGPLALVLPHHDKKRSNSKDERKIKEEIRELEEEKRRLKRERRDKKHYHRGSDDDDEVIIERVHSGGHHRRRNDEEVIVEKAHGRRREEEVKIEKDRKGNMAFVK